MDLRPAGTGDPAEAVDPGRLPLIPAEQIGRVAGEIAAEGVRVRDRDIADVIMAGLVRLVDIQGGWETKDADPLAAEEAAASNVIAIRAVPTRGARRHSVGIDFQEGAYT